MKEKLSPEDICTHTGEDYTNYHGAMIPPIFQNSLFVQSKDHPFDPENFVYTRMSNPTLQVAEKKLAELENAEAALVFSSGMAAISSGILSIVKAGDHILAVENVYGPTREFLEQYLSKFNVSVSFVKGDHPEEFENSIQQKTQLIYLESPTSFTMHMQDLAEIASIARKNQVFTMIDNTWATPLYQNPISFGIDLVAHTASKYLGGHSDIVAGVLAGSKKHLDTIQMKERALFGAVMDPHQAWLLIRGLRTLPVRLQQHQQNAIKIAKFLEQHPAVDQVLYPGLASHPQYELAKRQMSGCSGLMSFVLKGDAHTVETFIQQLQVFQLACSWGGFESLVIPIGKGMNIDMREKLGIHPELIRIHVGLENIDTLVNDLKQALNKCME
jgi:cystathionine beta-lyase